MTTVKFWRPLSTAGLSIRTLGSSPCPELYTRLLEPRRAERPTVESLKWASGCPCQAGTNWKAATVTRREASAGRSKCQDLAGMTITYDQGRLPSGMTTTCCRESSMLPWWGCSRTQVTTDWTTTCTESWSWCLLQPAHMWSRRSNRGACSPEKSPFNRRQDKMYCQLKLHWLPSSVAADKSWRRQPPSLPELNSLCSSVHQEEEELMEYKGWDIIIGLMKHWFEGRWAAQNKAVWWIMGMRKLRRHDKTWRAPVSNRRQTAG